MRFDASQHPPPHENRRKKPYRQQDFLGTGRTLRHALMGILWSTLPVHPQVVGLVGPLYAGSAEFTHKAAPDAQREAREVSYEAYNSVCSRPVGSGSVVSPPWDRVGGRDTRG